MAGEKEGGPRHSTLFVRAASAFTFGEMQAFARDIANRPFDRLKDELASLLSISDTKWVLLEQGLRKRLRTANAEERTAVGVLCRALASGNADPTVRGRARQLLDALEPPDATPPSR